MKLYELTAQLRQVQDWIDANEDAIRENGGALPEDVVALLDSAEGSFAEKVERVALYIRELDVERAAVESEARRLQERAASRGRAVDSLKQYLRTCMEAAGQPKVLGTLATVSVQASPPKVVTTAPLDLNEPATRQALQGWWRERTQYTLDAEKVLDAHKAGGALPIGVSVVRGTHLRIR